MGESDDAKRRRAAMDHASKIVTGIDVKRDSGADALAAQRFVLANFHRQCFDSGFDPMTMIECLLAGAAFFADNHNVSREMLAAFVTKVALQGGRELVFKPGG